MRVTQESVRPLHRMRYSMRLPAASGRGASPSMRKRIHAGVIVARLAGSEKNANTTRGGASTRCDRSSEYTRGEPSARAGGVRELSRCDPEASGQRLKSEQREGDDVLQARRGGDDERHRVDDRSDGRPVAVKAAGDPHVYGRIAFDVDPIRGRLGADRHRQVERDPDLVAGLDEGELVQA